MKDERCEVIPLCQSSDYLIRKESSPENERKILFRLSLRYFGAERGSMLKRNQIMNKIMHAALIRFQYHLPFIGVPQLRPNNETIFYFLC